MNSTDSTSPSERGQALPPPFIAGDPLANRAAMDCCPSATTLQAWSLSLNASVLVVLPCKRWTCRPCHAVKTRSFAARVRLAEPNRLLTLTVDPFYWDSPANAYRDTSRAVTRLARFLRIKYGAFEYFRATEVTKKGWPHYHLIVRSPYIPQPVVKAEWERLTHAIIVDVRQVKKSWEAYHYVTKYLSKMHALPWTNRHLAWSKHFFPPESPRAANYYQLQQPTRLQQHPADVLAENYVGYSVQRVESRLYTLSLPEESPSPCQRSNTQQSS